MNKRLALLLALILLLCLPLPALGNSAEPPGLTVIVSTPPEGLALYITPNEATPPLPLQAEKRGWETQYRYFYHADPAASQLRYPTLTAEWPEGRFELDIPRDYFGYNNQVTLDISAQTLEWGQEPLREPLLIAMRVLLTLIIEGAALWLFGYRAKRSWIAFLIVNLITQTLLNILFAGARGYWEILYVLVEVLIFIAEAAAFRSLLAEHSKKRAVFFALAANAASLILGGIMLMYLPV